MRLCVWLGVVGFVDLVYFVDSGLAARWGWIWWIWWILWISVYGAVCVIDGGELCGFGGFCFGGW